MNDAVTAAEDPFERRRRTEVLLSQAALASDDERRREALNQVVVLNAPVARSIARRFANRGCALEDLEQTALLALVKAVRAYDPSLGHAFLSYVVPCLTGAVKRHFRDQGWTVRPPRSLQELQPRVDRERHVVDQRTGELPTVAAIAARLRVEPSDVDRALAVRGCFSPTSLDLEVGGSEGTTLGDILVHDDDALGAAEARVMLEPARARLSRDDRRVVQMRFFAGLTQRDMGLRLGLAQPDVSRLVARILRDLRTMLTPTAELADTDCDAEGEHPLAAAG